MEDATRPSNSKAMFWIGWVLSGLASAALLFSGAAKFMPVTDPQMEESLRHIGWRADQLSGLGILEIAVVIIFLIPQTAVLGAILVTGYMGGAVATHVRVGDPFFVQVIVGMVFWLGLWLREPRLRELLPIRS